MAHLRSFADCILVCPEVEIGLGTPRATVRLVRLEGRDGRKFRKHAYLKKLPEFKAIAITREKEKGGNGRSGYIPGNLPGPGQASLPPPESLP